jgi:hypothetical protein
MPVAEEALLLVMVEALLQQVDLVGAALEHLAVAELEEMVALILVAEQELADIPAPMLVALADPDLLLYVIKSKCLFLKQPTIY